MIDKRRFLKSLAAMPFVLAGLSSCSSLGAFNAVIPKDGGARLASSNVAYGPESRQKLDIYVPTATGKPAGIVVFIYGGSWNGGSKSEYGFVGKALASRGYVVAIADYRLVPEVRYPSFVEDTAKAVAWAYRNAATYGADRRELYLMGHSAGAYNAIQVAVAPEFLRAEGLSPSVIRAVAGLSGPYDFLPLDVDATRQAFGQVKNLKSTQPVDRVGAQAIPPSLLVTGDADETVYPKNTKALTDALRRTGHAVEAKYYPGVDHAGTLLALAKPLRDNAPVLEDVVAFFMAHR